jgi:predicted dienelactone hydrolase
VKKPNQKMFLFMLLALLMLPWTAVQADETVRRGLRPDAPPYAVRGAYVAGVRHAVIGDAALEVSIWYPALNPTGEPEAITYEYAVKIDLLPPDLPAFINGRAVADAPLALDDGPYPLVVLSPGFSLGRTAYAWMAEHLASRGFVVMVPEHRERADETLSLFWRAAVDRPRDVAAVLDYAQAQSAEGGVLAGLIDMERVAVAGHSYGGYTALASAGAQLNLDGMGTLCEQAARAGDPAAWLCALVLPYTAELAGLMGLDSAPQGLWPSMGDPRVDAVVSMAGDAYFFYPDGLKSVSVPVLSIGGTLDSGTPYAWGTAMTYEGLDSAKKLLVGLENAEHMVFGSSCIDFPLFAEVGFYVFCSDAVWDIDRAHDLTNHFVTAFLLAELSGDADAAAALSPAASDFPGVLYQAQGY